MHHISSRALYDVGTPNTRGGLKEQKKTLPGKGAGKRRPLGIWMINITRNIYKEKYNLRYQKKEKERRTQPEEHVETRERGAHPEEGEIKQRDDGGRPRARPQGGYKKENRNKITIKKHEETGRERTKMSDASPERRGKCDYEKHRGQNAKSNLRGGYMRKIIEMIKNKIEVAH